MVERARCCPTPSTAHRPCHRCRCECAHAGLLGPTVPIRLFSSVCGAVLQERCIRASGGSGAPSLRRRRTLAALMGAKARRPVALRMEWALFDCRRSAGHRGQLQVRKSQRPCAPLALRPPVAPLSAVDCASACAAAGTAEPTRSALVGTLFRCACMLQLLRRRAAVDDGWVLWRAEVPCVLSLDAELVGHLPGHSDFPRLAAACWRSGFNPAQSQPHSRPTHA